MKKLVVAVVPVLALTGCATGHVIGSGTIMEMKQVAKKDFSPGRRTGIGAGAGAGTGAAAGAMYGAATCAAATAMTWGLGAGLCPAFMVEGALAGGGIGAAAGGAIGYASDVHGGGKGVYMFLVKPDQRGRELYVYQSLSQPLRPGDHVNIYQNENNLYIKK